MTGLNGVDEVTITIVNDDIDLVTLAYADDIETVSVDVPGMQGPPGDDGTGGATHTHDTEYYTKSEVNTFLAGKQAAGSYAPASHTHTIANVTGLQSALDGKQASGDYATNTALTNGLALKADSNHVHTIANVTGLQSALDGKQASGSYATAAQGAKADSAVQGNGTVLTVVSLSQAAYDALTPKVATTLYVIV